MPKLAVLDIELTGDTGGPKFSAEHEARLSMASNRLREELRQTGDFQIVDLSPVEGLLGELRSRQAYLHDCNGCDLNVGRVIGADEVMVAWVNRVSGLILTSDLRDPRRRLGTDCAAQVVRLQRRQ